MKSNFTFLIAIFSFVSLATAQSYNRCSTMEHHAHLVNEGLASANQLDQMDQAIQQWIDNNPDNSGQTLITIPVVFHVIYNTTTQNIPDARIFAQLDVMNKDFSRTNADTVNTPAAFLPVAANTEIQFALANRDPNGNPVTGITRTQTSLSGFTSSSSDMKFTSKGGKDIWNREHYLNVWIVNFTDWTLGFAKFPGGDPLEDGVVVHYRSVGGPSSNDINFSPYHLGRTATHEIGHWFGLYHTFQSGCQGTNPTSCINLGDKVCDTPPVSNATFNCPTNNNTCSETPTDLPDMVTNFMDYTDDPCMNIFTQGQKDRMQAAINLTRFNLFTSPGYVGINSVEALKNSINIYPNPSTGFFTLSTTFRENTDMKIFIYNILGKQIMNLEEKNLLRSKIDLDLSNFSNGIYYVVFESNGYTTSSKVSISR
jgi:hypothetical protein